MLSPFTWGQGGEKLTPGQVKVLREIAAAKANNPTPQNLGQGLASVGDALMYVTNTNKANEAERAGLDQVQQALAEARASGQPDSFLDVMGNEWASPAQQQIAGLLYERSQPSWQTFESGGDRYRYNQNDPNWNPEMFFDGPDQLAQADMPSTVREWEYFNALPPEDQSAYLRMKRSNPYLNLGTEFAQPDPANPGMIAGPAIPIDNRRKAAETAGGTFEGRETAERELQRPAMEAAIAQQDAKTDNVVNVIDRAISMAGSGETGLLGATMGAVPGSKAYDLRAAVTTIKANLGFAELQAMRDASPTGGALGQVAVQELVALQSTLESLDPNQSEAQLKANLARVKELLERQKQYRRAAVEAKYGTGAAPAPAGDVDSLVNKYLTGQ
jgi:hypothetical protein